jgi:hypothetical protein
MKGLGWVWGVNEGVKLGRDERVGALDGMRGRVHSHAKSKAKGDSRKFPSIRREEEVNDMVVQL